MKPSNTLAKPLIEYILKNRFERSVLVDNSRILGTAFCYPDRVVINSITDGPETILDVTTYSTEWVPEFPHSNDEFELDCGSIQDDVASHGTIILL